jgi:hypothetical protein
MSEVSDSVPRIFAPVGHFPGGHSRARTAAANRFPPSGVEPR